MPSEIDFGNNSAFLQAPCATKKSLTRCNHYRVE